MAKFLLAALVACAVSAAAVETKGAQIAANKLTIAELEAQVAQYKAAAVGEQAPYKELTEAKQQRVETLGEATTAGVNCGTAATGPCCPSNRGNEAAKGTRYKNILSGMSGTVVGTSPSTGWVNKCNTATTGASGFSTYLFFVVQEANNNYKRVLCNYQIGANLNLGTSGRIISKGGEAVDWTCLSRLQRFAVRVPLPGQPSTASTDAQTYAGFAQVKMIKLTVCKPGATTGSKVCSEKKVVLQCHQAACTGPGADLSEPQYGCKSGGLVAGIQSAALTWPAATAADNCAKRPKIAAGMIP